MIPERVTRASNDMLDREKSRVTGRRRANYKKKEDFEPTFDTEDQAIDVPEEELSELEGKLTEPENPKPKRKLGKKGIAIIVAASLATGAFASYFGYKGILNNQDSARGKGLINDFKSGSVCLIPGRIFTYQNHDFEYTTGSHLVEAATKQNIGIVRIGDQFVTPNGERVARVLVEIEVTQAKNIRYYEVNGQSFYIEPYGYEWNNTNGQCEKTETEVIERFVYANADHDYYQTPVPNSRVKEVLSVEEFDSISYEEAKKMDLIADVNDAEALSTSDKCNIATLKLIPNNKK